MALGKNYKNGSVVSVDMDKVVVMAAYSRSVGVCVHTVPSYTVNYTHAHIESEYTAITQTLSMSTDAIESFL